MKKGIQTKDIKCFDEDFDHSEHGQKQKSPALKGDETTFWRKFI